MALELPIPDPCPFCEYVARGVTTHGMRMGLVLAERALRRFRGNRRRAAKALNISTVTLWRRMKRYGLEVPPDPGD